MKSACTAAPAGRGDGRAATAVFVWSGVAPPVFVVALVAGSLLSLEGKRRRRILAPLCVRKVVFVDEHTNKHGGYYVIAPRSGRRRGPGGHSSPLRGVSVQAALFRRVPGIFHCLAALAPHRGLAAVRVVHRGSSFGL